MADKLQNQVIAGGIIGFVAEHNSSPLFYVVKNVNNC